MRRQGNIKELSVKKTKTGKDMYLVTLYDGEKYSGFGQPPEGITEELNVDIEYVVNGSYNNIKSIKPTGDWMDEEVEETSRVDRMKACLNDALLVWSQAGETPLKDLAGDHAGAVERIAVTFYLGENRR